MVKHAPLPTVHTKCQLAHEAALFAQGRTADLGRGYGIQATVKCRPQMHTAQRSYRIAATEDFNPNPGVDLNPNPGVDLEPVQVCRVHLRVEG